MMTWEVRISVRLFRTLFAISALLFLGVSAYPNGPGSLDLTFAGTGYKFESVGGGMDWGKATAVQVDGKIVVAGYTSKVGSNTDVVVARYNPDGSLDPTFDDDGKLRTAVSSNYEEADAVVVQPDGKIVVAGYSGSGITYNFLLLRYNPNGSLDPSFGTAGKVLTTVTGRNDRAFSLALQPDGKLLAGGAAGGGAGSGSALVRYNQDGSLDTSFGTGGIAITTLPLTVGILTVNSIGIQPDGRIVTTGDGYLDFSVVRYNANGSLDTTFDGDGIVTCPVSANGIDSAFSLALYPDGKVVAAGSTDNGGDTEFGLIRLNADGSLDTSFSGDGKLISAFPNDGAYAYTVMVRTDGKITAVGNAFDGTSVDFALLRCDPDGSLDPAFGGDGMVTTEVTPGVFHDLAYSAALQPDGKIIAAGVSRATVNNDDFALVRYNTDGSLDTGFDSDGIVTSDIGNGPASGSRVIVQPDGKIVAAAQWRFAYALTRYDTDGAVDTSFGSGGRVWVFPGSSILDLVLQPDGKILVVGSNGGSRTIISRYNPEGSLDASFGSGGLVTTNIFTGVKMAVQPDGKILVTGMRAVKFSQFFVVARFNPDGSFDTTFDGDGYTSTSGIAGAGPVVAQPDGKIVAGGNSNGSGGPSSVFALIRYNANGTIDTTFGSGGIVTTQMLPNTSVILSMVLLPDGRIVAGGTTSGGPSGNRNYEFGLVRYNPDGSLDTSFDGDGKAITPVLSGDDMLREIALQADGRLVVGGYADNGTNIDFALVRYNTDGSLDSSYGSGGKAVFGIGFNDSLSGLDLDPSGKAVMVGTTDDFVNVARITSDYAPLVDVGGRITSTNGQGIGGATVVLTNAGNVSQNARTNAFGYYSFAGVPSNEVYTVRVSNKRFRFNPSTQTITVTGVLSNVDFIGNPGSESRNIVKIEKTAKDGDRSAPAFTCARPNKTLH